MSRPRTLSRFVRRLALGTPLLSLLLLSQGAQAVGTRHFVVQTGGDFKKGELTGVAVDSRGELRAGLDLAKIEIQDASSAWDAVEFEGALYVATGNEGKLVRISGGEAKVVATAEAIALTSVSVAFGKLVVGAMPGGKLYTLEGDKLEEFATLEGAAHVWDTTFDEKAGVLYVATGPEGKLFRVTQDGTAQVYFDSEQSHLMSVAVGKGAVFAGSSGKARLYRISGPGKSEVLHDFDATEVRGIAVQDDGTVLAIANELDGGPRSDSISSGKSPRPKHKKPAKGSGELYSFVPGAAPERLFQSKDEHLVALSIDGSGRPVVGTGSEGRVFQISPNHHSVLIGDVEERQASAVILSGSKGWVVASDPVVAHPIRGRGGADAIWTSEVLDAGLRARFGKLGLDGSGQVEVSTRSGATKEPNESWSDWSAPVAAGDSVRSPGARFLQVRVKFTGGASSVVRRLDIPFLTDNARAVVTEVSGDSDALTSGSRGMDGSGGPLDGSSSSEIKLSWKVSNPDEDDLRYLVEYRAVGSSTWFDALKPGAILTKKSHSWETADLPEGRYRVRVTATDELANPPARVTRHAAESEVLLVDNTAPRLEGLQVRGQTISGIARDKIGPVRRIEVRVSGRQQWIPFEPKDGIFDEASEEFVIDLAALNLQGPAMVTLRAFDTAGNAEVKQLQVPGK